MDYDTGRSKGFAHVQFESVEGAAAAIAMSGTELEGRQLFIDTAKERAERPQSGGTPGGRGGASCHAPCTVHLSSQHDVP